MLTSLHLHQFRRYASLDFHFVKEAGLHVFLGANTAGKTTVLEGIHLLALLKSFRTRHTQEMIQWGNHLLRVEGHLDDGTHLMVGMQVAPRKERVLLMNDMAIPVEEYVGQQPVVFFSPEDINMLMLSPSSRRRYLDLLLCQVDRTYLTAHVAYSRVLRHRNALLKQIQLHPERRNELLFWDQELVRRGMIVTQKRRDMCTTMSALLPPWYATIAGTAADVALTYLPSYTSDGTEETLIALMGDHHERDIILGSTSRGPHRDDLHFLHTGMEAQTFASRGDIRSLVLALKMAEYEHMAAHTSRLPILLLDDVFSELDEDRQRGLLAVLPREGQVCITATHLPSFLTKEASTRLACYQVEANGTITP